jgi:hypothetical protein
MHGQKDDSCYGTAWTEGRLGKPSEPLEPGAELQFARCGLDASFLADLHVILMGTTYTEIAAAFKAGRPTQIPAGAKRIAGAKLAPYHTAHFYECSAEFRSRMAVLTSQRIEDISQNWYSLLRHGNTQSSPERSAYRCEIIQNLSALARVAEDRCSRLLLRVEYRMASALGSEIQHAC